MTAKTAAAQKNVTTLGLIEGSTEDASERETTYTMSDGDNCIYVTSSQKPVITKLLALPDFIVDEDDSTKGCPRMVRGRLPIGYLTLRTVAKGTPRTPKSDAPRKKRTLPNVAKCGCIKADGSPCRAIAMKTTGKCFKHSK